MANSTNPKIVSRQESGPTVRQPKPSRVANRAGFGLCGAGFSLEPDPEMRWIYDQGDPRYYDSATVDLRERRAAAIRNAPRWMIEQAESNDALRKSTKGRP